MKEASKQRRLVYFSSAKTSSLLFFSFFSYAFLLLAGLQHSERRLGILLSHLNQARVQVWEICIVPMTMLFRSAFLRACKASWVLTCRRKHSDVWAGMLICVRVFFRGRLLYGCVFSLVSGDVLCLLIIAARAFEILFGWFKAALSAWCECRAMRNIDNEEWWWSVVPQHVIQ